MSLAVGRLGWLGVALEPSYGTPTSPTDYIPFTANTLEGQVKNDEITSAYGIREKVFSSVATQQFSKGDVTLNLDPKFSGYFLVGALGQPQVTALGGGVFQHVMTRTNSNSPYSLSLISNRSTDQVLFPGSVVDQVQIDVKDSFASLKASLIGQFPVTSTSGTPTTASGTNFTYKNTTFAFGATVAAAQAAANLKLSDLSLTIKNNAEAVFRHGSAVPASVNSKDFQVEASFTLFFENTVDRNAFYTSAKQAANMTFTGAPLPGGFNEKISFNFYQCRLDTFALETGIDNFFAEKVKVVAEYDNANAKSVDCTVINQKALYI